MKDPVFLDSVRQTSEEGFRSGFYCAESVVRTLARFQGADSDLLPKIATGFCCGMARACGLCGALSGAVMGIGIAFGRDTPAESIEPCYQAVRQLIAEFEQTFGARNCADLIGCDLGTPEGQAFFKDNDLFERCVKFTGKAAEIAARIINTGKPQNLSV